MNHKMKQSMMKKIILLILTGWMLLFSPVFGQGFYKWVDEKGTTHFTDDVSSIPEKYRDQVREIKPQKEAIPPPAGSRGSIRKNQEIHLPRESASEEKDLLGRGETWWRSRAEEWNEKLKTARENYEKAYNDWKLKEQELESSKFKPDSLKRRLKGEAKVLDENVKDWEKQREEARNMVENILPKEASEYHANPDWLKIGRR